MSDPKDSRSHGTAMSDDERAAAIKKLQELRALQQQMQQAPAAPAQQQQPSVQPKVGYGYVSGVATYEDHHDDDDNASEGADEQEEAFLDYVESHLIPGSSSSGGDARPGGFTSYHLHEGEDAAGGAGVKVEHLAGQVRRGLNDFEVLSMAKMGDVESMTALSVVTGTSIVELTDNRGRNALHYAADSGHTNTLGILTGRCVPYLADEKGMTPMDVAVLAGHSTEVLSLLSAIGGGEQPKLLEEVLTKFAIEPPKFVMSKPAPATPTVRRPRAFWGVDGALPRASTSDTAALVITCEGEGKHSAASLQKGVLGTILPALFDSTSSASSTSSSSGSSSGLSSWLRPVESRTVAAQSSRLTVVTAATEAEGPVVGVVLALSLGGHLKGGSSALKNLKAGRVAVAGCLAVAPAYRGKGVVAPALMARLAAVLKEAGNETVFFASPTPLPEPPTMVGLMKCFRRVLAAPTVLRSKHAHSVLPEFFDYDEVLRADCALKGCVTAALGQRYEASLQAWCVVDSDNAAQMELVLAFLQNVPGGEAGLELLYVPNTAEDLRLGVLAPGLKAFVYVADGKVVDLVVYRLREPRDAGESAPAAPGLAVAQVVFAVFTTLKGPAKAEHVLLLAHILLKAEVLYVPAMCGFTDSDLVKANFDEVPALRHFLYAAAPAGPSGVSPIAPIPASKVAVPVLLL